MTLKLAIKNIYAKPWRAVATVFVVAVAVALVFSMLSFSDAVFDYLFAVGTASAGDSDLTLATNSVSDRILSVDGLEEVDGVKDVVPTLNMYALYQGGYVSLRGFDKGDYETLSDIEVVEGSVSDLDLNTDNVVISQDMAEEYGLKVGDGIAVKSGTKTINFYVVAIAKATGYFLGESPYLVIGNVKGVSRLIYGEYAVYNEVYLMAEDGANLDTIINTILSMPKYKDMTLGESQDAQYVTNQTNSMSAPVVIAGVGVLVLALAFVVLISLTSLGERKKFVSKLTVVGATKSQIAQIFLYESLILAFVGAVVGSILAGGVFALLLKVTLSSVVAFRISTIKLFGSAVIGFVTAVASVLIPIAISMRNTISANENERRKSVVWKALPIALVLTAVASVIVEFTAKGGRGSLSLVNVVLVLVALVVSVPFVLRALAKLLEKAPKATIKLTAKSLSRERRHTRLQILTAGMTVAMLLFMAWGLTTDIFTGYLVEFEDKVLVTNVPSSIASSPNIEGILDVEGVESAVPMVWRQGKMTEIGKGKTVNIIGSEKALDLIDFAFVTNETELRQSLLIPGNIVIDKAYQELYGLNVGDKVALEIEGKTANLTIAGITRHKLFNGNYVIASIDTFEDAYGIGADTVLVVADDAKLMAEKIRSQFVERNYYAQDALTVYQWDAESLGNVFDLVGTLAIVMAVLVFMVLVASAVASRPNGEKGRTAMLSAGMAKNTLLLAEVYEYAITAITAFVLSFAVSVLMTASLIGALRLFGLYFEFMYGADIVAIVGAVLSVGYALIPLITGFKKKYTLLRQK